jgi:hypothetical protein
MNWRTIAFYLDKYGRAVVVALVWVVLLVGFAALLDFGKQIQPFWLKIVIVAAVGVVFTAAITIFLIRAPTRF